MNTSYKDLLAVATIEAANVEDIARNELMSILDEHSFAVVRGLVSPGEAKAGKERVQSSFSVENDHAATGETPEDLYKNYQKFAIGSGDLRDKDMPKCLRTFYNPIFAEDVYGLRNTFRKVARLRNLVMDFDLDFATDSIQNGFWTASRIHQYPTGGGFMGEHIEDYIPIIYEQFGVEVYYQPLLVMSKRGQGPNCDYASGGGFFRRDGERYYYEDDTEPGDVLIYNTTVRHGVSEIDPKKPFRQNATSGRYAGFVTMYRDFS